MDRMKNTIKRRLNVYLLWSVALCSVLFVTDVSAKQYSFSWAENDGLAEGYRFYYKKGGVASAPFEGITANEGYSPIDIGNVTSFTISGLDENETYHFTITAYSDSAESEFTQVITVSPERGGVSSDSDVANVEDDAVSSNADAENLEGCAFAPDPDAVNLDNSTVSSGADTMLPGGVFPPDNDILNSEGNIALPNDEKLARWKLAFPIILDFLLDSDS